MKKINTLSNSGAVVSSVGLEKLPFFTDLIHKQSIFDAVNIENQNKRQSTAHTKTKAEVSGTGKKPFKQKHTGKARQGSRRNPHFVGGGCAFGPKNMKNYAIKLNKKVSSLSFLSAWNYILSKHTVTVLEKNFYEENKPIKTKTFFEFLKKQEILNKKILLVHCPEEKALEMSSRNIPNVHNKLINNVSVRDLLNQNCLLITQTAWASVDAKLTKLSSNKKI